MEEMFFKDARDYLLIEHELRKSRRPAYSLRAFARDLSISPSSLNDFLKARVGMSMERIEKVASILRWSTQRKEHFRDLILEKFDRDPSVRQTARMRVHARLKNVSYRDSLDTFRTISDWYHLAILELCTIRDGVDATAVANQFNLDLRTARAAIRRLINLSLLKKTTKGLKPEDSVSGFGDAGSSEAIKAFHSQILELAKEALFENESKSHDSSSLIYSVARSDLEKMNNEIRRTVLNIVNRYAQTPNPDCVQALTLQIFPLAQNSLEKNL